jgi:plastocyanin
MKRNTWVALCALAVAPAARAGEVEVTVEGASAAEAARTVVYLEGVEGKFDPPKEPLKLSQRGAKFDPGVLPVLKGTVVDMTNDDWVTHNVFSKSAPKPFDLGLYARDDAQTVTFDKPGVVDLFCSIHPKMNGVVLVLENPFFGKPDAQGKVTLKAVPAGNFKLRVYRPGATEAAPVAVKVPAKGSVAAKIASAK